jgi:hypothetical protein
MLANAHQRSIRNVLCDTPPLPALLDKVEEELVVGMEHAAVVAAADRRLRGRPLPVPLNQAE